MFRHLAIRLNSASQGRVAAVLLLALALIFMFDAASGATISFSPFYSVPVALAAWRCRHAVIAGFVAAASLARVYDYNHLHHDSWLLLAYDLLQSAAFFALVALLALQARAAVDRLARSTSRFRGKARQVRHQRLLESAIRRAVVDDVPAILAITVAGGESGAFDQNVMTAERQATLHTNFTRAIIEGHLLRATWEGARETVPVEFWVSEIDGRLAGYMMVIGLDAKHGPERELHALAVDPVCRGRGIGAALVDFFCVHYQHRRLVIGCKTNSQMMAMARRRSFRYHSSRQEYDLMVLDPAPPAGTHAAAAA